MSQDIQEGLTVYLRQTLHQLENCAHLRYAFWHNAYLNGEWDVMIIRHIRVLKCVSAIGVVVSQLVTIGNSTQDALSIYVSGVMLAAILGALFTLPDSFDVSNIGGSDGDAFRMLSIMAVSSGHRVETVNNMDKSWSRYRCFGGRKVGQMTFLENLIFNLSVEFEYGGGGSRGTEAERRSLILSISRLGWTIRIGKLIRDEADEQAAIRVEHWGIIAPEESELELSFMTDASLITKDVAQVNSTAWVNVSYAIECFVLYLDCGLLYWGDIIVVVNL